MSVAGGLLEDRVLQLQVPGAKKSFVDLFIFQNFSRSVISHESNFKIFLAQTP
jgi:hypothetical protein